MNKELKKRKVKRPTQKPLSKDEIKKKRDERLFKTNINTVFKNAGFTQIPTRDKEFNFDGITTDIDNIFVYENIIVISEDTCMSDSGRINDHLRKKAQFYEGFAQNKDSFVAFLQETFPDLKKYSSAHSSYDPMNYKLVFIYCSRYEYEGTYKSLYGHIKFLDYPYLRYFLSLTRIIHKSTKYELFKFLGLEYSEIGIQNNKEFKTIDGFLLPESPSGFDPDFKIVSFYIDPKSLIELCYVLRKDGGWRDEDALYQRLLVKNKISKMREYLNDNKRAYINNIIVTLPDHTRLENDQGETIRPNEIDKTKAQRVNVKFVKEFNSIGIIDGQHRIFSYHEGLDKHERLIAPLREKQNLLVTGIIYPSSFKKEDKPTFESRLFLEINDKQSRVKPDLKQIIESIVNPYETVAIGKAIITRLSKKGPLKNLIEEHFYESGKIKTTSIVSYGLKYIVRLKEEDTFFKYWKSKDKLDLLDKNKRNKMLLNEYINFCVEQLNSVLLGYKTKLSQSGQFTLNQKFSRGLSITALNGVIHCTRKLLQDDKLGTNEYYVSAFDKMEIDFSKEKFPYTSSHWKELGGEIYKQCF